MKLSDLHISRHDDGTYGAVWGPFMLKSGFQPIFKMAAGSTHIGAFEALCRPMRNGNEIAPGQFFPLVPPSESYRVELQTRAVHVLNAPVVLTDREWLFLNFDPSMFTDTAGIITALDVLDETLLIADIDRKRIVCEVTEHKTTENNLLSLVTQIRNRGLRIAVDDFGADSSDMERVRKLLPDIVKFDAQWITRLMDSGIAGAALLKDMVSTFKDRGIITLFEGIEHGWQLDLAVECGVEFVQGYVLAKPQTAPLDFHQFRVKQNMNGQQKRNPFTSDPSLHSKIAGFSAWENEISIGMETPSFKLPDKVPTPTLVAAAITSASKPMDLSFEAPNHAPATEMRRGGFTTAFGARNGSFGQKR
jgi:EAL domain-containing protein (putative c-di-GMP-specific phosphodiesterase class I)